MKDIKKKEACFCFYSYEYIVDKLNCDKCYKKIILKYMLFKVICWEMFIGSYDLVYSFCSNIVREGNKILSFKLLFSNVILGEGVSTRRFLM